MTERLAFRTGRDVVRPTVPARPGAVPDPRTTGTPSAAVAVIEAAPPRRGGIRRVVAEVDWAWRGLLLFTFVLFFRPQDQVPAFAVLHLAELFAIIGIGAMVTGRMGRRLPISRFTPEIGGILAFAAAMLVTIPTSSWPGGSVQVFNEIVTKLILIFILLVNVLDRPSRLDDLTLLMVLLSGYIGLRAALDTVRGVHMVEGGRLAGAIGGIFGNPNDLAMNMVVFIPFGLLWAFREAPLWKRGAAGLSVVLMLATVVATRSRGGTVGLVVMMAVLMYRSVRVKPAIATATVVAVLAGIPLAPASFWNRMASITDEQKDATGSRQARIDLMKEGLRIFAEHPIVGVGLGQFVNFDPKNRQQAWHVTHNALLQVATELGIVGLVPFLFLLYRGARAPGEARRAAAAVGPLPGSREARQATTPRDPDAESLVYTATATGPSLAGWFVCAFFASVALNWTFYYLLALAVATRDLARARQGATMPPVARRFARAS